jgi:hypothetical protein
VQHLPAGHAFSYGAVARAGQPAGVYFFLPESVLFRDGFETYSTTEWSETVP